MNLRLSDLEEVSNELIKVRSKGHVEVDHHNLIWCRYDPIEKILMDVHYLMLDVKVVSVSKLVSQNGYASTVSRPIIAINGRSNEVV